MRAKTLIWLVIVTVVIGVAAFYATTERQGQGRVSGTAGLLFPELIDQANDVAKISVTRGTESVVVERSESGWGLSGKAGYPVTFETVKSLILTVAEIEKISSKTNDPQRLGVLGLNDPDSEENAAIGVTLSDAGGGVLAAVLMGDPAPGGQDRRYIRLAEDSQSWLARSRVNVSEDPISWVDSTITNVTRDRVRRVQIIQSDLSTLTAEREEGDPAAFDVPGIPEGMKISDRGVVARLGNVLSFLQMEDIAKASELPFSDSDNIVSVVETFDGLRVKATTIEHDGASWTRFEAEFDELLVAIEEESESVSEDDSVAASEAESPVLAEVNDINERLGGWAFVVPDHKLAQLTQPMIGLIEPDVEETTPATDSMPPEPSQN